MDLRVGESGRRLRRRPLRTTPCHRPEPADLVRRHLDHRACPDVRPAALDARDHGPQRGLLHPGGARADRGPSCRRHALARGRPPSGRHLPRRHARQPGRLRGRRARPGVALGLRGPRRDGSRLRHSAVVRTARSPEGDDARAGVAPRHGGRPAPGCQLPPPDALLHPAGARRLGRARLDAERAAQRTRPDARPGGRERRDLVAGRGHRQRGVRGLARRPLDEALAPRTAARQRARHGPHRPGVARRRHRDRPGLAAPRDLLPRPLRPGLGPLRRQQHAHPRPDRPARASRDRLRPHEPREHLLRRPFRRRLRVAARPARTPRPHLRRFRGRGLSLRLAGP